MPNSVRNLIHKCLYKRAITQQEHDKIIRKLDSLEREGAWVSKPNIYDVVYCSRCDFELYISVTNYCPNCGAKMK